MRLYNTRTSEIERFRPRPGEPVAIYVCGITPYDTTHLGHAFLYVVFDVLVRHFETTYGWPVRYVQNVTDIDDDILKKAAATGENWRSLGQRWTKQFSDDLEALGLRPPDAFAGATAHIPSILANVRRLIELGHAYEAGGNVYFSVASDPEFGALAGLDDDEMLATANERGNVPGDPHKKDPLDFVLWQAGQPGEPAWHSPWGPGRPGWHIECSTLATELLGKSVDIHGGGGDLGFPHHCCEIAQAEPLTGTRPWVRWWLHVAMVRMDGEKMSKSLGNLVLVRDLLQSHHPDTIRLYLLGHHYRGSWEWESSRLEATEALRRTLAAATSRASGSGAWLDPTTFGPRFTAALEDDLDTPKAIEIALALADTILEASPSTNIRAAQDLLVTVAGRILGLWLTAEVPMITEGNEIRAAHTHWPTPTFSPPDLAVLGA